MKTIYSLDGTAITIYEGSDGEWYDSKGGKFTWIGDDRLTNEGGEAFTTYDSTVDDDDDDDDDDLVYCEYCGQYYEAGEVFRNHVCPERDAAMAAEADGVDDDVDDYDDVDDED